MCEESRQIALVEVDSEGSIFPDTCPVSGHWVIGCPGSGCEYLKRTSRWHYLFCDHPDRDAFVDEEDALLEQGSGVLVAEVPTDNPVDDGIEARPLNELPLFS